MTVTLLERARLIAKERQKEEAVRLDEGARQSAASILRQNIFMGDVMFILNELSPLFTFSQEKRGGDLVPRWNIRNEAGLVLFSLRGTGWDDLELQEDKFNSSVMAGFLRNGKQLREAMANAISRYL